MAQAGQPDSYDDELARIEASIADLKIRDMAAAKERTQIAAKIQAAQFQRDILAHANQQAKAKSAKARRIRRRPDRRLPATAATRRPSAAEPPAAATRRATGWPRHPAGAGGRGRATGPRPEWSPPGTAHTGPPGVATDGVTMLVDDPPPTERVAPRHRAAPASPPPASTRPRRPPSRCRTSCSALGALLIGVAAVVFAGVAVSNPFGPGRILAVATAIALLVAPGIARRGLTSTAETVAGGRPGPAADDPVRPARQPRWPAGPASRSRSSSASRFALTAVAALPATPASTRLAAPRYATVIAAAAGAAAAGVPVDREPGRLGAGPDRRGRARPAAAHHRDPHGPAGAALAVGPAGGRPTARAGRRPTTPATPAPATSPAASDAPTRPTRPPDAADAPPRPESRARGARPDHPRPDRPRRRLAAAPGSSPARGPAGAPAGRLGAAGAAGHPAVRRLAARADLRPALRRRRRRAAVRRGGAAQARRGARRAALRR